MDLKPKGHRFFEEDLIRVLEFLLSFLREANIQAMSECQALVARPSFLIGFDKSKFEAGVQLTPRTKEDSPIGMEPCNVS